MIDRFCRCHVTAAFAALQGVTRSSHLHHSHCGHRFTASAVCCGSPGWDCDSTVNQTAPVTARSTAVFTLCCIVHSVWSRRVFSVSDEHTHSPLTALCPGLPGWAGTRQVKPIWILLKQETASGSGISWAICKSASRSRQITTPAPHQSSFFYMPDALPAAQPTASKHWRQYRWAMGQHLFFAKTKILNFRLRPNYYVKRLKPRFRPIVPSYWQTQKNFLFKFSKN